MPSSRPLEERFWEKVDKQGPTGLYVDTPCWIWTASKDRRGYGQIGVRASHSARAHRVSWQLSRGPIPDGVHVLHRCHRTSCVNPDHLYLGGYAENSRDRVNAQRCNGLKGSDSPNSKLTEENVREILLLRASGQSATTIASKLSISPTTVCGICTGKSWQHISRIGFDPATLAPGALRGSAHPCYRITPEIQARMQEMRSMGMTYRKIASILQFSESAVYQACKKATNHSIAPEH